MLNYLYRYHCPGVPHIIVGLKSDIRDDRETVEKLKEKGIVFVDYQQVAFSG